MFLLQCLKALVELLVPWVENKDLEAKCRAGYDEIGDGDEAGDEDHIFGTGLYLMICLKQR